MKNKKLTKIDDSVVEKIKLSFTNSEILYILMRK